MHVAVPVPHLLWLLLAWYLVCTAQRTPRSCSTSPAPAAAAGCSAAQRCLSSCVGFENVQYKVLRDTSWLHMLLNKRALADARIA